MLTGDLLFWLALFPLVVLTWLNPRLRSFVALSGFLLFFIFHSGWGDAILVIGLSFVAQFLNHSPLGRRRISTFTGSLILFMPLVYYKMRSASLFGFSPYSELTLTPAGLSYYTLALVALYVDGRKAPTEEPLPLRAVFLSSSFFLTLPVGPICRLRSVWSSLRSAAPVSEGQIRWGLVLILNGLVKRRVADLISLIFDQPDATRPMGTIEAYTFFMTLGVRLYADFSGAVDIIRGVSLLLGIELPENFNRPFMASNAADFWRRWHMTLSQWAQTYLFYPLMKMQISLFGRERPGTITLASVAATMLFVGLWHGFSVNHVFWALYNAVLVALTPALDRIVQAWSPKLRPVMIGLNYVLLSFGFLLIANGDLLQSLRVLESMGSANFSFLDLHTYFLPLLYSFGSLVCFHYLDSRIFEKSPRLIQTLSILLLALISALLLLNTPRSDIEPLYSRF